MIKICDKCIVHKNTMWLQHILVARGCTPIGQHQESRGLGRSNFLCMPRKIVPYSQPSRNWLIGRCLTQEHYTLFLARAQTRTAQSDIEPTPFARSKLKTSLANKRLVFPWLQSLSSLEAPLILVSIKNNNYSALGRSNTGCPWFTDLLSLYLSLHRTGKSPGSITWDK